MAAFALAFLGYQVYRWLAASKSAPSVHFIYALDILSTLFLYSAIITMLIFLELKRRTRRIERQNFLIFGVFLFLYPIVQDTIVSDFRFYFRTAHQMRIPQLLLTGLDSVTMMLCIVIGTLSILRYLADIIGTRWLATHDGQALVRSINRQFFSR